MRTEKIFFLATVLLFSFISHAQNRMNKLSNEKSLYLKQHSTNPVDWMPWNKSALKLASEQNKLLIISVGYSSCHWCHVMEEETFSDDEAAQLRINFLQQNLLIELELSIFLLDQLNLR